MALFHNTCRVCNMTLAKTRNRFLEAKSDEEAETSIRIGYGAGKGTQASCDGGDEGDGLKLEQIDHWTESRFGGQAVVSGKYSGI